MALSKRRPNPVTVRLSETYENEVRSLAEAEDERPSVILRRLIRLGLERSRQIRNGNEAA